MVIHSDLQSNNKIYSFTGNFEWVYKFTDSEGNKVDKDGNRL